MTLRSPASAGTPAPVIELTEIATRIKSVSDEKLLAAIDILGPVSESHEATELLRLVRVRLRRLRPNRPPTLKRRLCKPFEDLLHSGGEPRPGLVARGEIEPLVTHLTASEHEVISQINRVFAGLTAQDPQELLKFSKLLWNAARRALATVDRALVPSAALMEATLEAAVEIEDFKWAFPGKPMPVLGEAALERIVKTIEALQARGARIDGYLLVIARRLAMPEHLLKALQARNMPVPLAIAREIDRLAIDDLSSRTQMLTDTAETASIDDLSKRIDSLSRILSDSRSAIGSQARKTLEETATRSRTVLKTALKTRILDTAERNIAASLQNGASIAEQCNAEMLAKALRRSRYAARSLGLGAMLDATATRVREQLTQEIQDKLSHRNPAGAVVSIREFYRGIRLVEIVAGSATAIELLDRARPAPADGSARKVSIAG